MNIFLQRERTLTSALPFTCSKSTLSRCVLVCQDVRSGLGSILEPGTMDVMRGEIQTRVWFSSLLAPPMEDCQDESVTLECVTLECVTWSPC